MNTKFNPGDKVSLDGSLVFTVMDGKSKVVSAGIPAEYLKECETLTNDKIEGIFVLSNKILKKLEQVKTSDPVDQKPMFKVGDRVKVVKANRTGFLPKRIGAFGNISSFLSDTTRVIVQFDDGCLGVGSIDDLELAKNNVRFKVGDRVKVEIDDEELLADYYLAKESVPNPSEIGVIEEIDVEINGKPACESCEVHFGGDRWLTLPVSFLRLVENSQLQLCSCSDDGLDDDSELDDGTELDGDDSVSLFDVGDVVRFKSGGMTMTVREMFENTDGEKLVRCNWANHEGVQYAVFPPNMLELVVSKPACPPVTSKRTPSLFEGITGKVLTDQVVKDYAESQQRMDEFLKSEASRSREERSRSIAKACYSSLQAMEDYFLKGKRPA
jgi:uncharacterized protein YodC (DUF2158 family)/translation initiation factor IF-1/DNA-directed RNA polymerase subunit H (RpoH/RPB5)